MAIDPVIPRSRRALLAAGIGGIAASVVGAFGKPAAVSAADGDNLVLGQANTASTITTLTMSTSGDAFKVVGPATASAITGESPFGAGVLGRSVTGGVGVHGATDGSGVGVIGTNASVPSMPQNMGVYGYAATNAASRGVSGHSLGGSGAVGLSGGTVPGTTPGKVGVYGYANQDSTARGIYGNSPLGTAVQGDSDSGIGLRGKSTTNTGLRGESTIGTGVRALSVSGRAINASSASIVTPAVSSQVTTDDLRAMSAIQGYVGPGALPVGTWQTGVQGRCDMSVTSIGVLGESHAGTAVQAVSVSGLAVRASTASATLPALFAETSGAKSAIQGVAGPGGYAAQAETGVQGRCDVSNSSIGVLGESFHGYGVIGDTDNGYGVLGSGYYGVYGTGAAGVVGDVNAGTGVQGWTGVAFAPTPVANVGVWAGAENGRTALQVSGVAKFNRSGRVSFSSGQSSKKVIVAGGIVSGAFALATLQTNRAAIYVQAVVPAAADSSITIYLNKAVTATTAVGWIVVG